MQCRELWEQVLVKLEPQMKRSHFVTWFRNTAVLEYDQKRILVGVPNVFAYDWLANRYKKEIFQELKGFLPSVEEVNFEVHSSLDESSDERVVDLKNLFRGKHKQVRKLPRKPEVRLVEGVSSKLLNPRYRFDNFVVGTSNRLAHAACMAVGHEFGKKYNPLFIYGGVGLGKTHLLQGTGNEILRRDPDKIVVYVPSERFVNEIVEAIGKRETQKFRNRYRNVDCLIFDDVQFLAQKEQTQIEFFNTFNDLYDGNKQLIISSDRPPKELSALQERLRSRFEMGMTVDVSLPDYETRLAILLAKTREGQVTVPQEVLEFIAANVDQSIRELEGVLLQAIAQQELENRTATVKSVAEILRKLHREKQLVGISEQRLNGGRGIPRISEVIEIVAQYFKVTSEDITGVVRRKEIMLPRQVGMYLIRKELGHSYESIGVEFGGRNHTTVMHACEQISNRLKEDHNLMLDVNAVKQEIGLA